MHCLRPLQPADFDQVVAVYRDAVISQAQGLYTDRQIQAWADHGGRDDGVRQSFLRGYGLASCSQHDDRIIEAFALLDPPDRLALLYCRGRSHRQGRASTLLDALESRARLSGCRQLRTEASQLSRPLLERRGWHVDHEEELLFAGIWFRRWRMIRELM